MKAGFKSIWTKWYGALDAEADRLCGAQRYERNDARRDTRAGSYQRQLQTKAGEVSLKVPKLRTLPFETAIIERYKRRESSVEEALVEMYLAGVSVRRVEDITEALWGTRVPLARCRVELSNPIGGSPISPSSGKQPCAAQPLPVERARQHRPRKLAVNER